MHVVRLLMAGCLAGWAAGLAAQGGTATHQAVSLEYPANHWGPEADGVTNLLGTQPGNPATDVIYGSRWFYRNSGAFDSREHPFPPPDSQIYVLGYISLHWNNLGGLGVSADEYTYVADQEGPSGGFTSRLTITNPGTWPIDLTFYHYLDLDVAGTFAGDSGVLLQDQGPGRLTYMRFSDGPFSVRYHSTLAQAYQVTPYGTGAGTLLGELNDNDVDNLTSTGLPFGPGDATAAFQFRSNVAGTSSAIVANVTVSSNLPHDRLTGALQLKGPGLGTPDLLFRNELGDTLGWAMRGIRQAEAYGVSGTPFSNVWTVGADFFFGDYIGELLQQNVDFGNIYIGGEPAAGVPSPPELWKVAATSDFDHDGRADILYRNRSTQKLSVSLMNGTSTLGSLVPSPDQATNANWEVVGAADFDADGNADLLWYNQTSGKIVLWYMDAAVQRITGVFTNPSTVGNNNWKALAVGDYGRGPGGAYDTQDVVWQNDTSKRVVVWYMDTAGNRTSGLFTAPDTAGPEWTLVGPR